MSSSANPVIAKWEQSRDALLAELQGIDVVDVRIPGWQSVDLAQGLRWLQSSIYEGFSVASKVVRSGAAATIWMKIWEYGEDEPSWDSVIDPRSRS
jgi:hypothetical protein